MFSITYSHMELLAGNFQRSARKGSPKYCESRFRVTSIFANANLTMFLHRLIFDSFQTCLPFFQVYLANLRLKEVDTDVLITAYEPIVIK